MDRDSILHFPASHYSTIPEPVRIQIPDVGSAVSPSPEEISDSGEAKGSRHLVLGSGNGIHLQDDCRQPSDMKPKQHVRYRECQKNHAANMGGYAVDGCGEFLPSGKEGSLEALKCAACSCHRNFHRREVEGEHACCCLRMRRDAKSALLSGPSTPALLAIPSSRDIVSHAQMVMSLSSPPAHSDELNASHMQTGSSTKKRFRTKFTQEQKEKMYFFAENLGWKITKHEEDSALGFCKDIGVSLSVFKVWMHNNKHVTVKKMAAASDPISYGESRTEI